MEKRRNCSSFPQYFVTCFRFSCLNRTTFSLRDRRLFELSEVDITRIDCIFIWFSFSFTDKSRPGVIKASHSHSNKKEWKVLAISPPDRKAGADIDLMKNICSTIPEGKYQEWTHMPKFYMAGNLHLSYCSIPHDMDGIWNRIFNLFRYLDSDVNNFTSVLTKEVGFLGLKEKARYLSRSRKDSETVVYVRNPYHRLFSAYYDRFYVEHRTCEHVGFQEFLDHVISAVKLRLIWGTKLMSPLVPKCRLCDIKPFEVIKEETFHEDMHHFLTRLKLSINATNTILTFLKKPELFIPVVLESKLQLQFLESCPSLVTDLGPRLWKSLQSMGLISNALTYPATIRSTDLTSNITLLTEAAVKACEVDPLSDEERKLQTHNALVEAYAEIKDETIDYLQEIFKYDFEMFGYSNKRPTWFRVIDTHSGETTQFVVRVPSCKGFNYKLIMCSRRRTFFPYNMELFAEGTCVVRRSGSRKSCLPWVEWQKILQIISIRLKQHLLGPVMRKRV